MEFSKKNWLTDVPRETEGECYGGLPRGKNAEKAEDFFRRFKAKAVVGKSFRTEANGDVVLACLSVDKCTINGKVYSRKEAKKLVQMMDELGWPCTWEQEIKPALKTWAAMG